MQLQTANEQREKLKKQLEAKEEALQESKKKWFASEQQKVDLMGKVAEVHTTQEKLQTIPPREDLPSPSRDDIPQLAMEFVEMEEARLASHSSHASSERSQPVPPPSGHATGRSSSPRPNHDYDPTAATRMDMPIVSGFSRQPNDNASERFPEERMADTRYSQRNPEPSAETTTTGKHTSIRDRFPGLAGVSKSRNDSPPRSTSNTQSIPRRQKASKPSLGSIFFRGRTPRRFQRLRGRSCWILWQDNAKRFVG